MHKTEDLPIDLKKVKKYKRKSTRSIIVLVTSLMTQVIKTNNLIKKKEKLNTY